MKTKELIINCQKGDQVAFSQLYEKYSDLVFSVSFKILSRENEAADIVQETFISTWEHIQKIDPDREFKNWIVRIAVNKCYDLLRKNKHRLHLPDKDKVLANLESNENNPEEQLNNQEIGELIGTIAKGLSPKQKIVFVLAELEEFSQDEIAEMTGMNKSTIKSNLNLARRRIGRQIKNHL